MTAAQKLILQVSKPLLDRTDSVADKLHITRSKLIREAIEEKVERFEREYLERELRAGFDANREYLEAVIDRFTSRPVRVLQNV